MASPLVWARPAAAPVGTPFCAVVGVTASVLTACRGRWEPSAADQIRWFVWAGERCGGCVREIEERSADPLLDPTWVGEGPRLARERLEQRAKSSSVVAGFSTSFEAAAPAVAAIEPWRDDVEEAEGGPPGIDGAQLAAELEQLRGADR